MREVGHAASQLNQGPFEPQVLAVVASDIIGKHGDYECVDEIIHLEIPLPI